MDLIYYTCSNNSTNKFLLLFFFNDTATTEIYTLSLHDALPISSASAPAPFPRFWKRGCRSMMRKRSEEHTSELQSRRELVCRLLLEKKKDLLAGDARRTQLMSDSVERIQQKKICRSSRQLSDEGAQCQLIQFVPAGESETHHAVGRILFKRAQGCAGQLFSQRQSELGGREALLFEIA